MNIDWNEILLNDLYKSAMENTGNEPSISCFYRAFDELKSYVARLETKAANAEADLEQVNGLLSTALACGESLAKQRDIAEARVKELEASLSLIGTVYIQRHLGINEMVNTDFDVADNIPDGSYKCYALVQKPQQIKEPKCESKPIKKSKCL